jgi:hypothetical protein
MYFVTCKEGVRQYFCLAHNHLVVRKTKDSSFPSVIILALKMALKLLCSNTSEASVRL